MTIIATVLVLKPAGAGDGASWCWCYGAGAGADQLHRFFQPPPEPDHELLFWFLPPPACQSSQVSLWRWSFTITWTRADQFFTSSPSDTFFNTLAMMPFAPWAPSFECCASNTSSFCAMSSTPTDSNVAIQWSTLNSSVCHSGRCLSACVGAPSPLSCDSPFQKNLTSTVVGSAVSSTIAGSAEWECDNRGVGCDFRRGRKGGFRESNIEGC